MAAVKEVYKNQLDMASVRLVKDKPLMSTNYKYSQYYF